MAMSNGMFTLWLNLLRFVAPLAVMAVVVYKLM